MMEAIAYKSVMPVTLPSSSNHAKTLSIGFKQLQFIFFVVYSQVLIFVNIAF